MSKKNTTTEATTEATATEAKASGNVKVRITKMGTRTCGCVFAKGAEIIIPLDKAKLLEELNQGKIIGTP